MKRSGSKEMLNREPSPPPSFVPEPPKVRPPSFPSFALRPSPSDYVITVQCVLVNNDTVVWKLDVAGELQPFQNVTGGPFLSQGRSQTRTDSTRSSSSTISSDAVAGVKPLPPPVAHKPSLARFSQTSEEQSTEKEADVEDPANKSFLGKVATTLVFYSGIICCHT